MKWLGTKPPAGRVAAAPKARRTRRFAPATEPVEERIVQSTMIPIQGGVAGITNGVAVQYKENVGSWTKIGGDSVNLVSLVDSSDQFGREVIFAQDRNHTVWAQIAGTNGWNNTKVQLDSMVASQYGITGIYNGTVYQFRLDTNWQHLGGGNVASIVVSHNPAGHEELFTRGIDGRIWSYNYDRANSFPWADTGGSLDTMIANINGISGTNGGDVWHYQDNFNKWYHPGLYGIVSLISSEYTDGNGYNEEIFAKDIYGYVCEYSFSTNTWNWIGQGMDSLVSGPNGVMGVDAGHLWQYQHGSGWVDTGGSNVISLVGTTNVFGQPRFYSWTYDHSIWSYNPTNGFRGWTGGSLD